MEENASSTSEFRCEAHVTLNSITLIAAYPGTRFFSFELLPISNKPPAVAVQQYTFPFLRPQRRYNVEVRALGVGLPLPSQEESGEDQLCTALLDQLRGTWGDAPRWRMFITTSAPPNGRLWDIVRSPEAYVGEEHILGDWLALNPNNFLWTLEYSVEFYARLYYNGLFTLPDSRLPSLVSLVTPVDSYCVDLTVSIPWGKDKKLRRHAHNFRLSINADFERSLRICMDYHDDRGGTWIDEKVIGCLKELLHRKRFFIFPMAFDLWEDAGDGRWTTLVATKVGFACGKVFHGITQATVQRDARSGGAIINRAAGHLLQRSGHALWYRGIKQPYMAEYDKYGARDYPRREFWPLYKRLRDQEPNSILDVLASGDSLVPPRPSMA
eukprot:GGOE01014811.1.p1 GENE.GGOE01014811.1~~GGOE01014811.1.p1  ORF type:complete len:396 (-),score=117.17 GGOE01014811.1:256-1404(-)